MIPNVTIMGSDTPRVSREYEALSRPCKCTSTLYTRVRATALNTVTSQVRLMYRIELYFDHNIEYIYIN